MPLAWRAFSEGAEAHRFMADQPGPDDRLESIVRRYSRLIRRAAERVGRHAGRELADDVEQRVYLNLWKQVRREQAIAYPVSYIYRCAVRETLRLLREGREGPAAAEAVGADAVDPPDPGRNPEEAVLAGERAAHVEAALAVLARDRQTAVRAHLAGFSVEDVMDTYGWSYQKARNLVARGMKDLREALRARGIDG